MKVAFNMVEKERKDEIHRQLKKTSLDGDDKM